MPLKLPRQNRLWPLQMGNSHPFWLRRSGKLFFVRLEEMYDKKAACIIPALISVGEKITIQYSSPIIVS